jgi:hypothetical protein
VVRFLLSLQYIPSLNIKTPVAMHVREMHAYPGFISDKKGSGAVDEYVHLVAVTHCFITGKTRSKAIRITNKQMPMTENIAPILMITPKDKILPP